MEELFSRCDKKFVPTAFGVGNRLDRADTSGC
jgi:hypothetical protein